MNQRSRSRLTDDEKQAIIKFHSDHPLEGCRRLTWIAFPARSSADHL